MATSEYTCSSGQRFATTKLPSPNDIALAAAVVKSKPPGSTVREYINTLRHHFASGSQPHNYVDRVSYWRSQHERLDETLQEALNENVDLKRKLEEAGADVIAGQPAASAAATKRKKVEGGNVVAALRSSKRLKRDVSPTRREAIPSTTAGQLEIEIEFGDLGAAGDNFIRTLFQLHLETQRPGALEPYTWANHLIRATEALPSILNEAVERHFVSDEADSYVIRDILPAASRALRSLFVGLTRLVQAKDGAATLGQVKYAFAQMFSKFTALLPQAASSESARIADHAAVTRKANARPPTARSKRKSRLKQQLKPTKPLTSLENVASLNLLTSWLCGILEHLDPGLDAHRDLFEAFAFSVLDNLGKRLFTLTFGHKRAATTADEIEKSGQADEIEDDVQQATNDGNTAGNKQAIDTADTEYRQARLEAPYLIHLLTRTLAAAPIYLDATLTNTIPSGGKGGKGRTDIAPTPGSTKTKPFTSPRVPIKGTLTISAKERLQRTLINCAFGTEGKDVDDPFLDCLRMPTPPAKEEVVLPTPKVKENEVAEWFTGEVWRLLGWEILLREGNLET